MKPLSQCIVAIDGPVAVGKSTVARTLAKRLNLLYIDTGAMYRAVTLAAIQAGVDLEDGQAVTELADTLDIRFEESGEGLRTFCNQEDVSEQIRTPEVSRGTSPISETAGVRRRLVQLQQEMGRRQGVVMEGRDIGTVVFPDADYKFFLVADADERARRRYEELKIKGIRQEMESVKEDLLERDRRDSTREIAPLRRAKNAIVVDTTEMSINQVITHIESIIRTDRDVMS